MLSSSRRPETDAELAARLQREENMSFNRRAKLEHAIAIESFSEEEQKKIAVHFETVALRPEGAHQQALMQAVLDDEAIKFEFVCNPVFIIGDGMVLDNQTARELLQHNPPWPSPKTALVFKEKDIVPCNVVILAMRELLNIMEGKKPEPINLQIDPSIKIKYQGFSEEDIGCIEVYYHSLELQHQRLFNILCRGHTGHILESPVLLPDGYLYEKSLMMDMLADAKKHGRPCYCPHSRIEFTEKDITICEFSQLVITQIKEQMLKLRAAAGAKAKPVASVATHGIYAASASSAAQAAEEKAEEHIVKLSARAEQQRQILIEEIRNLQISLGFVPRPEVPVEGRQMFFMQALAQAFYDPYAIRLHQPELTNSDMFHALNAAITALEKIDPNYLKTEMKKHKHCADVSTIAGSLFGHVSSLQSGVYVHFAKMMGTVKYQPGWYVNEMLGKVQTAIAEFKASNEKRSLHERRLQ